MTLRFIDSFDDRDTNYGKWTANNGTIVAGGRNGTQGHDVSTGSMTFDDQTTWVVGFAYYLTDDYQIASFLNFLDSGAASQLYFRYNVGVIEVYYGGGGAFIGTTVATLTLNAWAYVEVKVVIDDTNGSIEIRFDGTAAYTVSGIDTQTTATAGARTIQTPELASFIIDDLYICDGNGTVNRDFLGDCHIVAIFPNGAGTPATAEWLNSGDDTASLYTMINENPPDGFTRNYDAAASLPAKDVWAFEDVAVEANTILGVQSNLLTRIEDADSTVQLHHICRVLGTDYSSSSFVVAYSANYKYYMAIWEQRPGSSTNWVTGSLNSAEFGYEREDLAGSTEVRVDQLSVEVLRNGEVEETMFTPTSAPLYVNVTAGWTDISADFIGGIQATWGISGTTPNDRTADTGTMQFSLRNNDGKYTPGGASVTAGWGKGIQVRFECVYDSDNSKRFYGVIDNIDLEYTPMGVAKANVTVVDWMNYAAEHPITTPALQTNKTADEAIESVLANMPIHPAVTALDTGISTFPSVFDVVRKKSKALSEFSSLVNSELGYLYLRKDKNNGEQLVFENAQHRSGLLVPAVIPTLASTAGYLLMETGDKILQENGDKIYLNEVEAAAFTNGQTAIEVDHGANTANRIVVTAYPRKIDTAAVVLYTLGSPMQIGNGETATFTANYTYNGQRCGGTAMVIPVITTDYLLNTLADGTGTNLSTDAVVNVTFGGNSASVTIKNTNVLSGYITFFQLRGKGVYTYDEAALILEDDASVITYGDFERSFDQKYQGGLTDTAGIAQTQLFYDRYPRTVLQSFTYCANKSSSAMMAFLNLDVGDLISVTTATAEIAGYYIIQNVSFRIDLGKIIWVTYGVVEHYSLLTDTMTGLVLTFDPYTKQAVDFGYLPQVVQTSERTYSFWVNADGDASSGILSGPFADGGGVLLLRDWTDKSFRVYCNLFAGALGQWDTPANSFLAATQYHIAVVYNCWDVDAIPVVYINGDSQLMTEVNNPAGALNSEYGARVVIGNWKTDTKDYTYPWDGTIQDVRIYNRLLSEAEVDAIYNAGTPSMSVGTTSGLVFQAAVVPTIIDDDYDAATLTENQWVLDNIYGAVGKPNEGVESALI